MSCIFTSYAPDVSGKPSAEVRGGGKRDDDDGDDKDDVKPSGSWQAVDANPATPIQFGTSVALVQDLHSLCRAHPSSCEGLCDVVGSFVRKQRYGVLSNPKSWMWYYQGVLDYYRCTDAKIIVEVGVAFGAQTAYHLKNGLDFIEEYHVVDPFLAGYDPNDPMSKQFEKAAPGSTPEEVSNAWYQAMAMDLGRDGIYMPEKNEKIDPAPGCHLRMHHEKNVDGSKLFGNLSVDAVFIDGLHTYEGVMEDILSWMPKIKVGGSMILNDFGDPNFGVNRAVWEVVEKHNINVRMIDRTNALC